MKTTVISARVDNGARAIVEAAATMAGVTVSEFVGRATKRAALAEVSERLSDSAPHTPESEK